MADEEPPLADERRRALGVILTHKPVCSWRSRWRTICTFCGLRWKTDGELVGCLPVIEATVLLAYPAQPNRYTRVWPR